MRWRIVATRSQAELYCAGELVGTLYDFIHPAEMIVFAAALGAGGYDSDPAAMEEAR